VGGRRGLILIPEGRDGWGWSHFAAYLGKVKTFFEDSIGFGFRSYWWARGLQRS
jgi:hypothetical protein